MTETPPRPALVVATCAACGTVKFAKNSCPICGGKRNVAGSTRTLEPR